MHRPFLLVASALALSLTSCTSFKNMRTPSGEFCSDMAVIPAGEDPDLEYHRLQPVQSDIKARTEAERLESLRKAACKVGGDAVIEAVNEEVRNDQAQYVLVSSGTAVVWVRPAGSEVKPLTTHKKKKEEATAEPPPEPAATSAATIPAAPATATPTAAPVATAAPAATPAPVATAAPTAVATAAPTSTAKKKLPTNAAPKPLAPKKTP